MIFLISEKEAGERLDAAVSRLSSLSRSAAAKRIEEGDVKVNGVVLPKRYEVRAGDEIFLQEREPTLPEARPEAIPLDILYEDADILVIDKPKGMVVHPAPGNPDGTLVNALLHHCRGQLSGINGVLRPGIVHRIDKDTSGLLVVAKNDEAHRALAAELEGHHIEREYHALANGGFRTPVGTVDLPIGRHPVDRKKMAVIKDGTHTARPAVTHYEVIGDFGAVTYLKLHLETGRTHQIRVHMAALGHPLLGDTLYGGGHTRFEKEHSALLHGQALHAKRLTFRHPRTGETMTFECPLPADFQKLLAILERR